MSSLSVDSIKQPLSDLANEKLQQLDVFASIDSTNTYLMSQPAPGSGCYRVALADHQTAGRGRHERRWISAPGSSLCMSFSYTFAKPVDRLSGLTLAIGVGVIGALRNLGITGTSLKWPNDIVYQDCKLGGILTEVQSGRGEGTTVVAGIGINVRLQDAIDLREQSNWAQAAVDLHSIDAVVPEREVLAGAIIEHLYSAYSRFEQMGLNGFTDEWREHDWLRGREITVDMPDKRVAGIAAGVDADGALLVDSIRGRVRVISGSVAIAGARP